MGVHSTGCGLACTTTQARCNPTGRYFAPDSVRISGRFRGPAQFPSGEPSHPQATTAFTKGQKADEQTACVSWRRFKQLETLSASTFRLK